MAKFSCINHERDGTVWINQETEALRKTDCLCFSCARFNPGKVDNCHIAQAFFELCVDHKTAVMVTRCPLFMPKDYPASFKLGA